MNTPTLPRLHVGRGETSGGLTLFPVWTDGPEPFDEHVTGALLDQAAQLSISELASGPSVPELSVENLGGQPILLLEGEIVAGGSQSRMLNVDLLLGPRSSVNVPVSCVEEGRWSAPSPSFRSRTRAPMSLRRITAAGVHASRPMGARRTDQREVWDRIATHQQRTGVSSSTGSYVDVAVCALPDVERLASAFTPPRTGQRGVLIGIGGTVSGLELFGSARGLQAHWDDIVKAGAVDALHAPAMTTRSGMARRFIRKVEALDTELAPAVHLGDEISGRSGSIVANGLHAEGRLLHLAAFGLVEAA